MTAHFLNRRMLAGVFAALPVMATSALAQQIGVNAAIKNEVNIRSAEEDAFRAAVIGGDVQLADTITSGEAGALQVLLLDETVFTVGANAELTVDRFVYDPDQDTGEMAASVARGAFRFMSGRTARRSRNVSIETPVASMGIRGTIVEAAIGLEAVNEIGGFEGVASGGNLGPDASLIVLRGPGKENSSLNRDGAIDVTNAQGTVTLSRANTAVIVPSASDPIIGPFPLTDVSFNGFSNVLRTAPEGEEQRPVPPIILPPVAEIEREFIPPLVEPEEEQPVDRPVVECFLSDGIPVTDGGIDLGGSPDVSFDDFGSLDCFEG